ncbi:PEP-CTERM sorting domain-containing protein [Pirellulimonas nuda]|nr:PEP-CTERM sorting domain-containing protein [Pirellulimonas nuda]
MNSPLALGALCAALAMACSVDAAAVVYESFDYTEGANVVGQNGGVGFDGAWTGVESAGAGTTNTKIGTGLSFGALEVAGGSVDRQNRAGRGVINRTIAAGPLSQFTPDGSTVWFSLLMDRTAIIGGDGGFAGNTYATLVFGDTAFADASSNSAPANTGNALGVGFVGTGAGTDFSLIEVQGVAYAGGTLSTDGPLAVGDTTSFIVGKIDFAANGSSDTLTLYNVTDPGLALPAAAFATLSVDLDQSGFNLVSIADPMTSVFDEIRFGATLADVTPARPIPEPSSLVLLALGGLVGLRTYRRISAA